MSTNYKIKCTKTQLCALIVDYTALIEWVPALPPVRNRLLQFVHHKSSYWINWFPTPGVRYLFYLAGIGGAPLLVVEHYDDGTQLHREVIHIPADDLHRRGMSVCFGEKNSSEI